MNQVPNAPRVCTANSNAPARARLRDAALAFSFAAVVVHWLPEAPALWPWWALGGALLLPLVFVGGWGWCAPAVLLGLAWGGWHAQEALGQRIDAACATALTGRVAGLPSRIEDARLAASLQRFDFLPDRHGGQAAYCHVAGRVRLSWVGGPQLRGGERWAIDVRLRAPYGTANAHGFDQSRFYVRERIVASGYVVRGERLPHQGGAALIDQAREALRERLRGLGLVNGGVLAALTLGDSTAIPRQQLARYRRTATMHLLVISGLHIGVVTAFAFFVGRAGGLLARLPGKTSGVVLALAAAGAYVLLAGAGLSLVRAFTMAAAGMAALLAGRMVAPSAAFAYALAVVLLLDPLAPLAAGFWLSFGAVAVLLGFFAPRRLPRSWVRSALLAQLAIALVFTPATVSFTGLLHPLGIAVNLIAVPLVTLFVVPLALAGMALIGTFAGPWLLFAADYGVTLLGQVLALADEVEPWYVAHPGVWLPWSVAVAAACLLPVSRLAAVALMSALVAVLFGPVWRQDAPVDAGEAEVIAFDVGQGTAVLVRTARHTLLYDAGPGFLSGANAGDSIVLPALRGLGIGRLDALVLSHGDIDHVGGAASVLEGMRVGVVLAGEPVPGIAAAPCRAGDQWRWDGVDFALLHPPRGHTHRRNNASCVLLVTTAGAKALLPGDIERWVEHGLDAPQVDWLLVPHHGSATSSTAAFVAATRPQFAVVGARWDNRFGHPHRDVVARYRAAGAHIVSTAVAGALRWHSARPAEIQAERCLGSLYWRRQAGKERRQVLHAAPPVCGPVGIFHHHTFEAP